MMDGPDLDAVLADIDRDKETTLGHLLAFMQAFNLRFGAATTDRQRETYRELYPILDGLRDETSPADPALAKPAPLPDARKRPGEYFSGMDFPSLERQPAGPRP